MADWNIRNYRYVMSGNNTGVLGIEYEEVDHVFPNDEDENWKTFVEEDSDGLAKTGQKLLQMAIESYVYSILCSQSQTRWPIVGQGAKSSQTQDMFHWLVKDTLIQDDPVKLVSDMRTAIENTNVLLNLVISPGIILIPSSMIILKEKVARYNSVLTLATKDMKFGVNEDVNRVATTKIIRKSKITQETTQKENNDPVLQTKSSPVIPINEKNYNVNVLPALGSAIAFGFLIAKYVI